MKLALIVAESGRASSATIIKGGGSDLDSQAASAIKEWQFEPALRDGKSVPVCIPVEMTFQLY